MIVLAAIAISSLPRIDEAADKRLAKLRSTYAAVRSATVQTTFRKVGESAENPAVELNTVTYFERPNHIYCQVLKRGEAAPFLSYVTDGKRYRRVENGSVTTGDFDPNESLPRAGVTMETLALWSGETLLRPGSRLLPHALTTNAKPVLGPDGRSGWNYLAMNEDDITIFLDPKTGLVGSIHIGTAPDPITGGRIPRYLFRVDRWELGTKFPKKFFAVPEETARTAPPGSEAPPGKLP